MSERQFWIGVVSRNHVAIGVAGGFAQLNHGKAAPLERMRAGDGFAYYSPRTEYPDGPPLQAFTAIGRIRDGIVYQAAMGDFRPFRLAVDYLPSHEAPIKPLMPDLASSAARRTGAPRSASASCACRRTTSRASRRRWTAHGMTHPCPRPRESTAARELRYRQVGLSSMNGGMRWA